MNIPKNISYSSLQDWQHCAHFYKLVHIEKLKPIEPNVWIHYGHLIHRYIQLVLTDKLPAKVAAKKFLAIWTRFCSLYKKQLSEQLDIDPLLFRNGGFKAILLIENEFKKEFGDYKILRTEERLSLPSSENFPQQFKGFIDVVAVQLENGKTVIADLKSCSSSYMFNKYLDRYKSYQLVLYKHFYAKKYGIDPKEIETYFITIERAPKSKRPLQFTRITSGPKKIKNALEWMNRALCSINENRFIKKKSSCHKYGINKPCIFYSTHCK